MCMFPSTPHLVVVMLRMLLMRWLVIDMLRRLLMRELVSGMVR